MNRHCQHYKWLWCLWSRSSWKDHSFDWQPSSWLSSRCLVRGQVLKCFWQLNHVIFIAFRLIDFPCACKVTSITSDSSWPYGPWPARLLLPWDSPGKNTGVGCHFLLQGIFPTQGFFPEPEIKPRFPALQADSLPCESPGKPNSTVMHIWNTVLQLIVLYCIFESG